MSTPGVLITTEFAGHAKQLPTETEFVLSLYVSALQLKQTVIPALGW